MMIVTNPEPSPSQSAARRIPPAQRRLETQERRRRLAVAYGVAVTGYPRGGDENVYALPPRYSSTAARADDAVLVRTYTAVGELRERIAASSTAEQKTAAARELAVLVGRLRPGQRRYLAQQMLTRGPAPDGSVCSVCRAPLPVPENATILPCGDPFHEACIQATLETQDTCACTICKRDLTLAALLHDAMADCTGTSDPDALWKSLPVAEVPVPAGTRPLTPPLSGPAPALAAVKESWRAMINAAYDNDTSPLVTPNSTGTATATDGTAPAPTKDRAWQLDTDLRRLDYTTPRTLRDRANIVYDIARALHTAGWSERYRRAMAYLDQHRVRANPSSTVDLSHRCAVCETPIASSETSSPPCGHTVHAECWPSWFQKHKHTQCAVCHRDIAIYACMDSLAVPDGPKGAETMKELWLTVEEVYF